MPSLDPLQPTDPTSVNRNQDSERRESPYLTVKEVAEYLHINTKKVYALVNEGKIPATKVTGKWLFPRKLVDHWIMESSHGGLLTDRLVVTGSNDSLIQKAITQLVNKLKGHALIGATHTSTELGLSLLAKNRADVAGVRWGPRQDSDHRHPALIQNYSPHKSWILVRVVDREYGLIVSPDTNIPADLTGLFRPGVRWILRQKDIGPQNHLSALMIEHNVDPSRINIAHRSHSQHEAASALTRDEADVTPGTRSCATEYGLDFVSLGWESYDFALNKGVYFRTLFQKLMEEIQSPECLRIATILGGYDFKRCGQIIWSE